MLLTKKSSGSSPSGTSGNLASALNRTIGTMDRRAFLRQSGMVAGAGAFASQLPFSMVRKAQAAAPGAPTRRFAPPRRLRSRPSNASKRCA